MRGHQEADERQRIVHLLVREQGGETGAIEHLDAEDLAGLVAGTLLKTEIARVENHLMSCAPCRERSTALQRDYEAGVVPILLRRPAGTENRGTLRSRQLPRRWTPWILGALATLAAVILSQTGLSPFGSSGSKNTELSFILKRLGNPQLKSDDGETDRPAEPGAFIEPGRQIDAAPGDYLEVLRSDGGVWALIEGRWEQRDVGSVFTQRLFNRAALDREEIARMALNLGASTSVSQKTPRIIHPVNTILDRRPHLRWAGATEGQDFEVRILEKESKRPILKRDIKGHDMPWPDDLLPLEVGLAYVIELRLRPFDSSSRVQREFQVLDRDRREVISLQLERIGAIVDRGPSMLRAEYLRQEGLHGEAREELERLRTNDSENVELLIRLKYAYSKLGLSREVNRIGAIIQKRR